MAAGAWGGGDEPVPEATDVQPASNRAMAQVRAAVRVTFPRGNALPGLRGDGMTAILPHPAAMRRPVPLRGQALFWRSSSARRYSSMTMSLSSWTEVSLASLLKVISPCCSRLIRSQISMAWP